MRITVLEYQESSHQWRCRVGGHATIMVDPFVGCALHDEDGERERIMGLDAVGKTFEIPDDVCRSMGAYCPQEGQLVEVKP